MDTHFTTEIRSLFKEAFVELVRELHSERFMRIEEVSKMVQISERALARMVKDGEFPKPRKPTAGMSRWLHSDVVEWMRTRPTNVDDLNAMLERKAG